jgi:uncharacterized protein
MATEPWYSEGLRFECTQCGNCCTGAPGVVWVDEEELAAIAEYTGKPLGEVRLLDARLVGKRISLREHANGDCVYFDGESRRCTIYPVRPKQCRTWPFWRSHLVSREAWEGLRPECPGVGGGAFVSLEEVERRAGLIEM